MPPDFAPGTKKALSYAADRSAYFSTLAIHMSERALEGWLERAKEDENWTFQSILFPALGRGGRI